MSFTNQSLLSLILQEVLRQTLVMKTLCHQSVLRVPAILQKMVLMKYLDPMLPFTNMEGNFKLDAKKGYFLFFSYI